jgi:diguanylate cyclase (GGDEF)-like protein/PAS domain S-box-containing protein
VVAVQTLDSTLGDDYIGPPTFNSPVARDHVAGFVTIINAVAEPFLESIRSLGKPVVMVSHRAPGFECPVVLPDNRTGIVEAVDHLVQHGHTRIAFAGNVSQHDVAERYDAYAEALRANGLSVDPDLLFVAPNNLDTGGDAVARAVLAASLPCTAIVAATDSNARGIMRALQATGVKLPGDMAVTGFNDEDFASQLQPPLATVRQSFQLLGEVAGRLVVDMVQGRPVPPGEHRLKAMFVPRDSCGCESKPLWAAPVPHRGAAQAPVNGAAERLRENMAFLWRDPSLAPDGELALKEAAEAIGTLFVEALESLVVPVDGLRKVSEAIYRAAPRPETISVMLGCAHQHRLDLQAELGFPPEHMEVLVQCVRVLHSGLRATELRVASEANQSTQTLLRNAYQLSTGLALSRDGDPRSLAFLTGTRTRAACLALWVPGADAGPAGQDLELVGVYGPGASKRLAPRATFRPESFPPVAALTAEGAEPGDIVFVAPVRTNAHDWGLLASVEPPAAAAVAGRDMYFQWVAMLGLALDHQALVQEIRLSEQRYALAASAANDGLWDWDVSTARVFYSPRWKAMLGYGEDDIGRSPGEWFSRVAADDLVAVEELVAACLRGEESSMECEHRMIARDGSSRWVLCRAAAVPGRGRPATRLVGSHTDITERKELEDRLRQYAMYDPLTGLPNRRLFMDRLARAVRRAKRIPGYEFSVLFMDLDDFKVVNDSLGHMAGDSLLVKVAKRIGSYLRENDTAVRFGGDEFAILLDNIAAQDRLDTVVRRLHEHLATPYEVEGQEVVVSATIGIATSTTDYDNPEDVVRDADTAMYRAKSTGRGSHVIFDKSMHAGALSRLRTEQELRQAIENKRLALYYQPVVLLGSHRVTGVEALVRWPHPERGLMPPINFLPLAEDTGLIVPLGRWVLEEACRQAHAWRSDGWVGEEFRVAVNVSNREFWHREFLLALDTTLARTGAEPSWLTIEVTEGVIMHNPEVAQATLMGLRERGVQVYLDDFGTGYSSLEFVHRFPIDGLKVDRSFVARSTADHRGRELVRTIIMLGRNLGMGVVAEGIEEPEQERTLREVGCLEGQGFLFAKPTTPALLEGVLREAPATLQAGP